MSEAANPRSLPPRDRVMDRRTFLGTLTGGLLAAPLTAEAQRVQKFPLGAIEDTRTCSHREMF
jgi:hypothetical protein